MAQTDHPSQADVTIIKKKLLRVTVSKYFIINFYNNF